MNMLPKGNIRP